MNNVEKLYNNLESIENLPAFPQIALEVTYLLRKESTSAKNLYDLIQKDPVLVSQILKTANSPFYGLHEKVSSLVHAINLLGFVQIENIVIASALLSTMKKFPVGRRFNTNQFLDHSFGCGITAKIISNILNFNTGGLEFSAGVIHDIGKVILDLYDQEDFDKILNFAYKNNKSFYESEKVLFGITHCDLAKKLLKKWSLPEDLIDAVVNHHSPKKAKNQIMASIISVADLLTYSEGIGFGGNYSKFLMEDQEGWKIITSNIEVSKKIDLALFTFKLFEQIDEAKKSYFKELH
ncbi:HD domain protein [Desulfurella amilsii]|uniref:HD domain protein n=1 Tax=Desulfurella amilsii TaxID=1562698 RepID=A0A1X4Y045_9BACT|nr:HDOD domain-containing protein [Desulfurella amilsii]OSS43123.1 HD domain protein [Desulfurella amilsii]